MQKAKKQKYRLLEHGWSVRSFFGHLEVLTSALLQPRNCPFSNIP